MLQLLTLSSVVVVVLHPELLKPVQRAQDVENSELPTALAERNMPNLNINYISTDGSAFTNDQGDMIEQATSDGKNEEHFAAYGIFTGRTLRHGKKTSNSSKINF